MKLSLFFDGGINRENGIISCGWAVVPDYWTECLIGNKVIHSGYQYYSNLEVRTSNVAEWHSLEDGLYYLWNNYKLEHLNIYGDSQLILYQLSGRYNCRPLYLSEYRDRCRTLLKEITETWEIKWIRRIYNTYCDSLCATALCEYQESKK